MKFGGVFVDVRVRKIKDIRDWKFSEGYAGVHATRVRHIMYETLETYDLLEDYMSRDGYCLYDFNERCLFDIMVDQSGKKYAVFINNIFDNKSNVITAELLQSKKKKQSNVSDL